MIARSCLALAGGASGLFGFGAPAGATPEQTGAAAVFNEARGISERDASRFWGVPLYGPMLLVDPADLGVVANQTDAQGVLQASGPLFTGALPKTAIVSNTAVEWGGKRWTELLWPLQHKPDADAAVGDDWRPVMLAHEMFHRIQPGLGLVRPDIPSVHLDTLQGRYLLMLEWRALARALTAPDGAARSAAVADAILFRAERYRLFPEAAPKEAALETNEGLAEYTGVRVGLQTPKARVRYALYDLATIAEGDSFVRGFAYATGPAYGLLLDEMDLDWRGKLASGQRLDQLLASAARLAPAAAANLPAREDLYDPGGSLYASEVRRDHARAARMAALTASLVDGPVLRLPLRHPNYSFNPQTLLPLGEHGTVYPTLHLSDMWGDLEVEHGGALLAKDMTLAVVSVRGADLSHLSGDGWRLTLKPGWNLQPAARNGDIVVARGRSPP